ncbi:DUF4325 domain-containing protein [Photobacterium sp. GB-50]|uniref:STAS-like domain-containing protein n=1 Tax=Photobacterium sp. GB-50 TaxID=2022107 RepID=UPI000D17B9CD|nr:STAS-like domain-containing protein [Photobacterium sp. GB-50]PSW70021.1 DUF4325 domain-containing protein [Photobacterium sp. GB-50]
MEYKDKMKEINVVKDFYPRPKWRYRLEGEGSGEAFREEILREPLKEGMKIKVDLTGYNRYGPSFISEAFGGLIRNEGLSLEQLRGQLTIVHDSLPSIVKSCWMEIEKAESEKC